MANLVTISYSQLQNEKEVNCLFPILEKAFGRGSDCLGALIVSDLPTHYSQLRSRLLSYSTWLNNLPEDQLMALERKEAYYVVGYSRGKEAFATLDDLKGSFYANPVHEFAEGDGFPEYTTPNVWPLEELLPGFREAFVQLGQFVVDVGALVARACDAYVTSKVPHYPQQYLQNMVKASSTTKARLLHYFSPRPDARDPAEDDWCGEHLDHSCLTGLTSAMFASEPSSPFNPSNIDIEEFEASPDPLAGLYIRDRAGRTTKVSIPRDCLAFQTGEALQVATNGWLRATPHYVRGCRPSLARNTVRNTLAVFMQPGLNEKIGAYDGDFAQFANEILQKNVA
ncbi:hypothetical protein NEOLI_000433 [Neolecta irregularis DAH-3]|uniref:Clavaminate synthase-like protein n=1 Tax=Neolecta irregularis (strain DAH-3) TaxID=1198029 RepID=A0A1U7LWT8_NEOID|nr:hypothetical protein NEOLI_000433 [Neolecta irregularis DAH-3]|eukprot:OLL27137.1 hypothetical protein NEOLI_000433 [Neolecta irregularis DAH-3]